MSNARLQAGHVTIETFKIYTFDRSKSQELKGFIGSFNIEESINNASVRGTVTVFEAFNILKDFPIIGEELLEIIYVDFFGRRNAEYYYVYAVTDVKPAQDASQAMTQYMLHFVSVGKFLSETFRIQKAYNSGTIADFIQEVYDEYYKVPVEQDKPINGNPIRPKRIEVESTEGNFRIFVPRYNPEQAIKLFTKRAFSSLHKSQTFRFFEARDGFYFATNEFLLNKTNYDASSDTLGLPSRPRSSTRPIYTFARNFEPDISADRQITAMNDILSIDFGVRVNTIRDINEGGYKRRVYEIDLLTTSVWTRDYDHSEEFNTPNQKLLHSGGFVDTHMSKQKEVYFIRDYTAVGRSEANESGTVRENQFYAELHTAKAAHLYHMDKNRITMTIHGRNNLYAGSYVRLNLVKAKYSNGQNALEKDDEGSGLYLVETVNNVIKDNQFKQYLTLTRDGVAV